MFQQTLITNKENDASMTRWAHLSVQSLFSLIYNSLRPYLIPLLFRKLRGCAKTKYYIMSGCPIYLFLFSEKEILSVQPYIELFQ